MFNLFRRQKGTAEDAQSTVASAPTTSASGSNGDADAALVERITAFLSGSTRPGSAQPGRVAQVTAALATPPAWDNSGALAAPSTYERETPVPPVKAQPAPPPEAYDLGQGGAAWQG